MGDNIKRTIIRIFCALIPIRKYRSRARDYLFSQLENKSRIREAENPFDAHNKLCYDHVHRYLDVMDVSGPEFRETSPASLPIWQLWLQGYENAPVLVRKCIDSVSRNSNGRKVFVLDKTSYRDYIDIPQHIIDKFEAGIISNTHFSDVVRVYLLERYGGIWIDATVFLSNSLPKEITMAPYFAFTLERNSAIYSYFFSRSWFIYSQPEHQLIRNTVKVLSEYWRNENSLMNYFLFHIIQKCIVDNSPALRKTLKMTPCLYADDSLFQALLDPYDENRLVEILNKTSIHKLSYKFDSVPADSLLDHIMREDNSDVLCKNLFPGQ